jgi:S1-C subfamily serine protease
MLLASSMLLSESPRTFRIVQRAVYPWPVSWVDLVIAALVVLAALRGRARGAIRQLTGWVGFVVGLILGTLVAPSLSTDITRSSWRPLLALVIVLAVSYAGLNLGQLLGSILRRSIATLRLGSVDSVAGVAIGVAGTLFTCWLFAGLLGSTSWGSVASAIQGSRVLGELDRVMPPIPSFEARVQSLFRSADFPSVFASVVAPTLPPGATGSSLGPVVTSLGSPSDVVKVLASGACSAIHQGTAFYVSAHEAVTNAHVVAGATHVTVGGATAYVAFFDPVNDVAVLRVPSVTMPFSRFLTGVPAAGTAAQVIGFPLDGTRTGAPAIVNGEITGQARDIYNSKIFSRTVLVVNAQVQPGNSGSPLFVGPFVAGMVSSKSYSLALTAYAIPADVVRRDVASTPAIGTASTQRCLD